MGSNPVQAQGITLFLLGFVLVAAGLAGSLVFLVAGLAAIAGSCALFLRCKPWEHQEE